MGTFILGFIVGATLAIVGYYLATKYMAKVETKIKVEVGDAEALIKKVI
jgi:hypothetical protein